MSPVAVVTDSTSGLTPEMIAGLPVYTIPLHLMWDGEQFLDGVDIQADQVYQRMKATHTMPRTSQANPLEFINCYKPLLAKGYQILSVHLSGRLTGTVASALQAVAALGTDQIEVVDSETGGIALGWHALQAARAAVSGATLKECRAVAEFARQCAYIFFIPGSLEFLHKGGRIGGAAHLLGSVLKIHPILEPRNGVIEAVERVRTMGRAMERLVELVEQRIGDRNPVRLAGLYADLPDLTAQLLDKAVQRIGAGRIVEAFTTGVSPAIGTHIGPGSVGLAFMTGL
jgi:DegV family protein with EDD domain